MVSRLISLSFYMERANVATSKGLTGHSKQARAHARIEAQGVLNRNCRVRRVVLPGISVVKFRHHLPVSRRFFREPLVGWIV